MFEKRNRYLVLITMILTVSAGVLFNSCDKEEVVEPIGVDTPPVIPPEEVIPPVFIIDGFAPQQSIAGELIIIEGTDMHKVESVEFPGGETVLVENFINQNRNEIVLLIPNPVEQGVLTLSTTEESELVNIETIDEFFVLALSRLALKAVDPTDAIISDNPDVWPDFIQSGGLNWSGQPFFALTTDAVSNDLAIVGNGTEIGNSDWVWGWGMNWTPKDFQASKSTHTLRFDMKLTKPFGNVPRFFFLINGNQVNLGTLGFSGETTFEDWFTIEVDLSQYGNLPEGNIEATGGSGDWGFAMDFENGTADVTGLYMDNWRFSTK